jgi:hypothetical protein
MARLSKTFTAFRLDDPKWIAGALAKIEYGLKRNSDPVVDSDDEENPGLLQLLRQAIDGGNDACARALTIEIAFELGRYAAGDSGGARALLESWRRGGISAGKKKKERADLWRIDGKKIWFEKRGSFAKGDPRRKTQLQVAKAIRLQADQAKVWVPKERTIVTEIRKWDAEMRRSQVS